MIALYCSTEDSRLEQIINQVQSNDEKLKYIAERVKSLGPTTKLPRHFQQNDKVRLAFLNELLNLTMSNEAMVTYVNRLFELNQIQAHAGCILDLYDPKVLGAFITAKGKGQYQYEQLQALKLEDLLKIIE